MHQETAPRGIPERLRTRAEFAHVMRKGRRSRDRVLMVVALPSGRPSTRVGLSVGKHIGGAVVRNRLKRRLRMIVRDHRWQPGFDVILVGQSGAASASYDEIGASLAENAKRLRLLDTLSV